MPPTARWRSTSRKGWGVLCRFAPSTPGKDLRNPWRRARRTGQGLWDPSAKRLAWNLAIPLVVGGLFCLSLLWHGAVALVAPATLVFYGLALLNASKYTLDEIRWLGLSEVVLGLLATSWPGAGLMFWALGFGVLHILYGGLMWYRHESSSNDPA